MKESFSKLVALVSGEDSKVPEKLNSFHLPVRLFSKIFWEAVLQNSTFWAKQRDELINTINELDKLRTQADCNTGSIPAASAWWLYSVARYFRVSDVIEIGTFIGKSTIAIATAMEHENIQGQIHTCDLNNAIDIPFEGRSKIIQHKKKTSTQMLNAMAGQYNFAHFDGRVQKDDISLLKKLLVQNAVIALDDFEGMEKGVANLIMLREAGLFQQHFLVYPCPLNLSKEIGFSDQSSTAILLPKSIIEFTNQA
jgi:hypothetical protein